MVAAPLRHPRPLFEQELFRSPIFSVSAIVSLLAGMGFYPYAFVFVVWLLSVWRYDPLMAGLAMIPAAVVAIAIGPGLAKIGERHGFRPIIVSGFVSWCLSFRWYATAVGNEPAFVAEWLPGQIVSGVGAGATLVLIATVALDAVPSNHRSPATSFAIRQVGGVIGAAVLIAIVGNPTAAALPDALRAGWLWSAGCFAPAAAVSVALRRSAPEKPEPDALLEPWYVEVPDHEIRTTPQAGPKGRVVGVIGLGRGAPAAEVAEALSVPMRRTLRTMTSDGMPDDALDRARADHDRCTRAGRPRTNSPRWPTTIWCGTSRSVTTRFRGSRSRRG